MFPVVKQLFLFSHPLCLKWLFSLITLNTAHAECFYLRWCLGPVLAFKLSPVAVERHHVSPLLCVCVFLKLLFTLRKLKGVQTPLQRCLWNMLINQLVATEVYHIVKYNKFDIILGVENWAAHLAFYQNHSQTAFFPLLKMTNHMKHSKLKVTVMKDALQLYIKS